LSRGRRAVNPPCRRTITDPYIRFCYEIQESAGLGLRLLLQHAASRENASLWSWQAPAWLRRRRSWMTWLAASPVSFLGQSGFDVTSHAMVWG
jgi:hypothetical protein